MSNALLKAAMRQNARLRQLEQENQTGLGQLTDVQQNWNPESLDQRGILGNLAGGAVQTIAGGAQGIVETADAILNPNSIEALQANLSEQQHGLLNKHSKRKAIEQDLLEAKGMLSQTQDPATRQVIQQLIDEKQQQHGLLGFNQEEQALWDSPYQKFGNMSELVSALEDANLHRDAIAHAFGTIKDFGTDKYSNALRQARMEQEYTTLDRAPNVWDSVWNNVEHLDTNALAQGIGNLGAFVIPGAGGALLAGDAGRVYHEGTREARQDNNSLVNTGYEQARALGAAGLYAALNKLSLDKTLGATKIIPKGAGGLSHVPVSAITEGVTEAAQEALESVAAGRPIDQEALATAGVHGFATSGAITGAASAINKKKDVQNTIKTKLDNNARTPEQIDAFVRESVKTPYDEQGKLNQKYNPATAIEALKNNPDKAEVVIKYAEHHTEQAQKVLDALVMAEQTVANENPEIDDKERQEAQEMLSEMSVDEARQNLVYLQKHLAEAKSVFNTTFKAEEINGEKQEATPENILRSPLQYTKAEIDQAIEQSTDEEQIRLLRKLSEFRVKENKLKNPNEVYSNITEGNEQYRGLREYYQALDMALQTSNSADYIAKINDLEKWYSSHRQKAELLNTALADLKTNGAKQLIRNQNGQWELVAPNTIKGKEAKRQNGAIDVGINTRNLAAQINQEVQLIGDALEAYDSLADFFDSNITKANSNARTTVVNEKFSKDFQEKPKAAKQVKAEKTNTEKTKTERVNYKPFNVDPEVVTNKIKDEVPDIEEGGLSLAKTVATRAQGATKVISLSNSSFNTPQKTIQKFFDHLKNDGDITEKDTVLVYPPNNVLPAGRSSNSVEDSGAWNPDEIPNMDIAYQRKFNEQVLEAVNAGATIKFSIPYQTMHARNSRKGTYFHPFLLALAQYLDNTEVSGYERVLDSKGQTQNVWRKVGSSEGSIPEQKEAVVEKTPNKGLSTSNKTIQPKKTENQQKSENKEKDTVTAYTNEDTAPEVVSEVVDKQLKEEQEQPVVESSDALPKQFNLKYTSNSLFKQYKNIKQFLNPAHVKELLSSSGKEVELSSSQVNQLKSIQDLVSKVDETIGLVFDPKAVPEHLQAFVSSDGKQVTLDSNLSTGVALALYDQVEKQGYREAVKKDDILKKVLQKFGAEYVASSTYNAFATIGVPRNYLMQEMGKEILDTMGIKVTDNATVKQQAAVTIAMGELAYHMGKELGLLKETEKTLGQLYSDILPSLDFSGRKKLLSNIYDLTKNPDISPETIETMDFKQITQEINKFITGNSKQSHAKHFYAIANNIHAGENQKENFAGMLARISKENLDDDVIGLIFDKEKPARTPLSEPPKKLSKDFIKRTKELAPDAAIEKLLSAAQHPWSVLSDRVEALEHLSNSNPQALNAILGLKSDEELANLHEDIRVEKTMTDTYYRDRMGQVFSWVKNNAGKAFYLMPTIWSNNRSGYENTIMNPQAQKLDRIIMVLEHFKTEVNPQEELFDKDGKLTIHGHFLMGVAEGIDKALGKELTAEQKGNYKIYAPDKVQAKHYLPNLVEYLQSEPVQKAITATQKLLAKETLTQEDTKAITAILEAWDSGELGLGSLMELAKYQQAKDAGNTFETYQGRQSDGVTNGPVTSQMLLAELSDTNLGGIFSNGYKSIQEAIADGTGDLYTQLGEAIGDSYKRQTFNDVFTGIDYLISRYLPDISSRSIGKVILTPFNYGAGMAKAIAAIARESMDRFEDTYYKLSDLSPAESKKQFQEWKKNLGESIDMYNYVIRANGNTKFDTNNADQMRAFVVMWNAQPNLKTGEVISSDVTQEMNDKEFLEFIHARIGEINNQRQQRGGKEINIPATYRRLTRKYVPINKKEVLDSITKPSDSLPYQASRVIYNLAAMTAGTASRDALNEQYGIFISKRNDAVDVLSKAVEGYKELRDKYIHDKYGKTEINLTLKEQQEVDETLKPYRPFLNSSFGVGEDIAADLGQGLSLTKQEKVQQDESVASNFLKVKNGRSAQYTANITLNEDVSAGVAPLALAVQSMDAYVSFSALSAFPTTNYHDANAASLKDAPKMAEVQNKAWFENQTNYNFDLEVTDAIQRVAKGYMEFGFEPSPVFINGVSFEGIYAGDLPSLLSDLTSIKYSNLEEITHVHQYGLEEGTYEVSDTDKNKLQKAKQKALDKRRTQVKFANDFFNYAFDKESTYKSIQAVSDHSKELKLDSNINWKTISNKLEQSIKNIDHNGFVSILASSESTPERVSRFLFNLLSKSNQVDLVEKQDIPEVNYQVVNHSDSKLNGKSANFIRANNTIYVSSELNEATYPRLLQSFMEAQLNNTLSIIKKGISISPEADTAYKQLTFISTHLNKLPKDGLTDREKQALSKLRHGDVEQLVIQTMTDVHVQSALNKMKFEKKNLLNRVMGYIKTLLMGRQENVSNLAELVLDAGTVVLGEALSKKFALGKTVDKQIYKDASGKLEQQTKIRALNNLNRKYVNHLLKKADNNTIPVKDMVSLLKNAVQDNSDFSKFMKPTLDWLQSKLSNNQGKVVFVETIDHYGLDEDQAIALAEEGSSFFDKETGNIYIPMSEVSALPNSSFTAMVHELSHAALHDNFSPEFQKLYQELSKQFKDGTGYEWGDYALSDINEFFAETLTDKYLQKLWGDKAMERFFHGLGIPQLEELSNLELPAAKQEEVSAESVLETLQNELLGHLNQETKWNSKLTKKISPELKQKVFDAVEKDYGQRYENFAAAVNRVLKKSKYADSMEAVLGVYRSLGNKDAAIIGNSKILKSPNKYSGINTPQAVFDALVQDETHLHGLMATVVNPLSKLIDARLLKGEPGQAWFNHITDGTAFFVSEAYQAGFSFTPAESFVMETVELALSRTLDEVVDTPAYRKLYESYQQAKTRLTPQDFHDGDWLEATPIEKQIAQDKWNFLFRTPLSTQKKSDYLTRFLAIGVTNQEVGNKLGFTTKTKEGKSLTEKGTNLLNKAVDWWFNRDTAIDDSETVKNKLKTISEELASIYLRNRDQVEEKKSITDIIAPKAQMVEDVVLGLAANTVNLLKLVPGVKPEQVEQLKGDFKNRRLTKVAEQVQLGVNTLNPNQPIGEVRSLFNELVGFDSMKSSEGAKDLFTVTKQLEAARSEQMESVKRRLNDLFGKVDKNTSKAITNTIIRADLQSLTDEFSTEEILSMVSDRKALKEAIRKLESKVESVEGGNAMLVKAKNLAHYMIHRRAISPMLVKNAYAIASGVGEVTNNANKLEKPNPVLVSNLDKLISLYALNNVRESDKDLIKKLNKPEAIHGLMVMHKNAVELSKAEFANNPFSYTKGYTPNITNPYKDFIVVNKNEVSDYETMGYKMIHALPKDSHDPSTEERVAMLNPDANQNRYVSGILSLANSGKSGTTVVTASDAKFEAIAKKIMGDSSKALKMPYKSFHGDTDSVYLIPSFDTFGNVISFSYEMQGAQMDAYMDRVNDFSEIMAASVGKATVAQALPRHNEDIMDYLVKERKEASSAELDTFVEVSATAPTKKGRELWHALPPATKDYVLRKYGKSSLQVKNNMLDWLWGYQKVVPFALRAEDYSQMNAVQQITHGLLQTMLGKKIKNNLVSIYNAWLEMVKLMKDFVVVRGFTVLFGNIASNMSVLMINGGNPVRAIKDISTALKYSLEYKKDRERYMNLLWKVREGVDKAINQSELAELQDKIERNPLKDFIDAGMMPSIVNDVNLVNSEFDFKPKWLQKLDEIENKTPDLFKDVMKYLFVSKDSGLHQTMMNVTQQSDFVFRYAMYQQEIRRGTEKKEAMRIAKDTYIDYDVPTSKYMQWANDIGLWMFSKFTMRFQRVLARLVERHPLAVGAEHLVMEKVLGMPSVWSLGILSRLYEGKNPMRMPLDDVMGMHGHAAPIQILSAAF